MVYCHGGGDCLGYFIALPLYFVYNEDSYEKGE